MTNFSTNQVMQFYVLGTFATTDIKQALDGGVFIDVNHNPNSPRYTDKIENVMWGKLITTSAGDTKVFGKTITFNEDSIIPGQNYVINVSYPSIPGLGVEGWTTKTVVVTADSESTSETMIEAFIEELKTLLKGEAIEVDDTEDTSVVIRPVRDFSSYKRGLRPINPADFRITTNIVYDEKTHKEIDWAKVETTEAWVLPNCYKLADMEYFAMGERADQYRMAGYPNVIDTEYKVKTDGFGYNVLIVHYAYKGPNDTSYKSEKDLILVSSFSLVAGAQRLRDLTGAKFTVVDVDDDGNLTETLLEPTTTEP